MNCLFSESVICFVLSQAAFISIKIKNYIGSFKFLAHLISLEKKKKFRSQAIKR